MAKGGSKPDAARAKPSKVQSKRKILVPKDETLQDTGAPPSSISKDSQQHVLNLFKRAYHPSSDDAPTLQEVKGCLFDRNFASAFGKPEYLRVYASRWSPSRALAYLRVFDELDGHIVAENIAPRSADDGSVLNVLCIGGGAGGELAALAGWLRNRLTVASQPGIKAFHVTIVDIADWSEMITALLRSITTEPEISKYASQTKRDENRAFVEPDQISAHFKQLDVLSVDNSNLRDFVQAADLITFMFTLNELYATSMASTQTLLSTTLSLVKPGSHLLVVDSPGSYSTVSINGADKKYPMQWLLDHTLLGDPRKEQPGTSTKWKKLLSDESRWFRMPAGLYYPIELENMRFQIHLYKRLADSGDAINHQGI